MKHITKIIIIVSLLILFFTSCSSLLVTFVRFENRSESKTVEPIWDGIKTATLAPGEITEYVETNPGNHTIQWKNASNGKVLTSLGWPNLVSGKNYTFPYTD